MNKAPAAVWDTMRRLFDCSAAPVAEGLQDGRDAEAGGNDDVVLGSAVAIAVRSGQRDSWWDKDLLLQLVQTGDMETGAQRAE